MLKVISDIFKSKREIESCILRYGHLSQHNYYFYLNYSREKEKCIFFDFGIKKGIFAYQKQDTWRILTDPIAPQDDKNKLIVDIVSWLFKNNKAKKIIMEDICEGLRKELVGTSKNKSWRVIRPSYSLVWPIFDLENWTGGGKDWKRLRNLYHKFFKDNRIEIKRPGEINSKDLEKMILGWKKQRRDTDHVHLLPYLRFVESGFEGCDIVRIFECDSKPISIVAGWPIPNSDRAYYSCMGIYNYDYRNIGEASYWDELLALKKAGYKKVDLGGSEGGLLAFKMKFHPVSSYKTYNFSILKR